MPLRLQRRSLSEKAGMSTLAVVIATCQALESVRRQPAWVDGASPPGNAVSTQDHADEAWLHFGRDRPSRNPVRVRLVACLVSSQVRVERRLAACFRLVVEGEWGEQTHQVFREAVLGTGPVWQASEISTYAIMFFR